PNLVFRPGFLTKAFFAGRRVRYAPPMHFFIFVSFTLFLLLQVFTNRSLETLMNKNISDPGNKSNRQVFWYFVFIQRNFLGSRKPGFY
ncbi:MAG TPA: DUF3667 domain-containing protein, partial [Prolixibacteraceae bacterium]|nr:DUF3667 domain-containing protein [Prolixibacteraceae bacterium]